LLLIARDCTVLKNPGPHNVAKPVRLLEVLGTLLGDEWGKPHQKEFDKKFEDAYVNFTHWIMTDDPLPQEPTL
jgi:hypothetical protein